MLAANSGDNTSRLGKRRRPVGLAFEPESRAAVGSPMIRSEKRGLRKNPAAQRSWRLSIVKHDGSGVGKEARRTSARVGWLDLLIRSYV